MRHDPTRLAAGFDSAGRVSLHFIGDSGVLFDRMRQVLFGANPMATLIWCLLEERQSVEDTVAFIMRACSAPRQAAERYVADALGAWSKAGLLGDAAALPPRHRPAPNARSNVLPLARRSPDPDWRAAVTCRYGLLRTAFEIGFATHALFGAVGPRAAPSAGAALAA
jgi:hypothetical protein